MTSEKMVCVGSFADEKTLEDISNSISENSIEYLARIFKALGDPSRLKIVYVLYKSPLCVCDIANALDLSQSSVSHHLRILRDLNLVKFKREGKLLIYSLDDEHVFKLMEEGLDHVEHKKNGF